MFQCTVFKVLFIRGSIVLFLRCCPSGVSMYCLQGVVHQGFHCIVCRVLSIRGSSVLFVECCPSGVPVYSFQKMCKYFHGQALCGGPLKTLKMCKYFHLQAVCGGSLYIYTLALNLSSRAGKGWLVRYLICFCHTCQPCSCCGRYRQLGTKMAAVMLLVFVTFKHRFLTNRTKH